MKMRAALLLLSVALTNTAIVKKVNRLQNEEVRAHHTLHCTGECQQRDLNAKMSQTMKIKEKEHAECVSEDKCPLHVGGMTATKCENSYAGEYECSNVDLVSFTPLAALGTEGDGNDIWGWTDSNTGKEYAIVGLVDGTSFIDVSDPETPEVLGVLPTHTGTSLWRDVKVYKDHAFIVSDNNKHHGMQVFDLTQLRDASRGTHLSSLHSGEYRHVQGKDGLFSVPEFKETTWYGEHGSSHNIVINEETGFAYSVGSDTCNSGLHIINIQNPKAPTFAGCFSDDGYTHDAQCVIYKGPDKRYQGHEICFNYNEDTLTIVDVTNKDSTTIISRKGYDGSQYTHQGWLFADQQMLLLNDELDEMNGDNKHTRTMVWDVRDLDKPRLTGSFYSEKESVDHNLYNVKEEDGTWVSYESNYCAGLRILDITRATQNPPVIEEIGYFDVAPDCDEVKFAGSWSVYPYFKSGNLILSSIERGLFVLRRQ